MQIKPEAERLLREQWQTVGPDKLNRARIAENFLKCQSSNNTAPTNSLFLLQIGIIFGMTDDLQEIIDALSRHEPFGEFKVTVSVKNSP